MAVALTYLILLVAPFVILYMVADAKNANHAHVFWGLLGFIGVVIGLIIMLPQNNDPEPEGRWS